MNGKDIFIGLNYIDQTYIEEAELAAVQPQGTIRTLKRPLLIAAIVTLMLMLVGCAAVYLLRSQDMAIGTVIETRPVFADNYGIEYVGTEAVPNQILTVNGIQGTPAYQASMEWFEFQQSYDQDGKILESVWENWPTFPKQYNAFTIYSQEMADKVDEIAAKYELKLPGECVAIGNAKDVFPALGIDGLLHPDCKAMAVPGFSPQWYVYEGGNFHLVFFMRLDDENGQWPYPMINRFYFLKQGYFDPQFISMDQTANWEEWNYTTKNGNEVLLLLSDSDRSQIICQREDAMIVVAVESVYSNELELGRKSWPVMTRQQLEQVADAIDFDMQPNIDLDYARERSGETKK